MATNESTTNVTVAEVGSLVERPCARTGDRQREITEEKFRELCGIAGVSDIPNLKRQLANVWFIVDSAVVLPDISKYGAAVKEVHSAYARYRSAKDNLRRLIDQTESALAVALRLAETSEHLAMGVIRPIYEEMMKAKCECDEATTELEVALTRAETLGEHIDKQFVATGNAEAAFNRAIDETAAVARRLIDSLSTSAAPRNREEVAAAAKLRSAERFGARR